MWVKIGISKNFRMSGISIKILFLPLGKFEDHIKLQLLHGVLSSREDHKNHTFQTKVKKKYFRLIVSTNIHFGTFFHTRMALFLLSLQTFLSLCLRISLFDTTSSLIFLFHDILTCKCNKILLQIDCIGKYLKSV